MRGKQTTGHGAERGGGGRSKKKKKNPPSAILITRWHADWHSSRKINRVGLAGFRARLNESQTLKRSFCASIRRPRVAEKKMAQKESRRTVSRGLRRAEIKSYRGKELICPSLCPFLFLPLLQRLVLIFRYPISTPSVLFAWIHQRRWTFFPLLPFVVKMETSNRLADFFLSKVVFHFVNISACELLYSSLSSIQTWLTSFAITIFSVLSVLFPLRHQPFPRFHARSADVVAQPEMQIAWGTQCTTGNSRWILRLANDQTSDFTSSFSLLPPPTLSSNRLFPLPDTVCRLKQWSFCRLFDGQRDGFQSSSFLRFVGLGRPGALPDRLMERRAGVYLDWLGNCFRVFAGLKRIFRLSRFRGNFMLRFGGIGAWQMGWTKNFMQMRARWMKNLFKCACAYCSVIRLRRTQ